jgi:hypothetical protein
VKVFYFGCWDAIGHFLWTPYRHSVPMVETPWGNAVDGGLCPGKRDRRGEVAHEDQREGHAALHHRDGWTALAFWDRSVDTRPNSNSAFLAEGTRTLPEMMALAWSSFPAVMARLKVAIRVDGVSEGGS